MKVVCLSKESFSMNLAPIGEIHSPYKRLEDIPRQGRLSQEICEIEVFPEYAFGLKDIEQCSHLFILLWMHLGDRRTLMATPPKSHKEHGVFATRSPGRPNPIALDIVELLDVKGNRLTVRGMDALDGTILLDIKPYSPEMDCISEARIAWQADGK
jgi:tRNA (adenine37-N6)-methyltransferase